MKPIAIALLALIFNTLQAQKKHTVQPKETVYGISKMYSISQTDLLKANPTIEAEGLQPGDVLQIPGEEGAYIKGEGTVVSRENGQIQYTVAPKETLYSIGKKFNVSQEDLLKWNPSLAEGLKANQQLTLYPKNANATGGGFSETAGAELVSYKPKTQKKRKFDSRVPHTVQRGETLLSLMMQYKVQYQEILDANPGLLRNGLKVGSVIEIPTASTIDYAALPKFNDEQINLLFLLPFSLNEPKSKVRNGAVEFLTGAKVALENLAGQGKKINLIIRDTKNNKEELMQELSDIEWESIDAVIGPLYGELVAELAQELAEQPIDIFSPFNNDKELEQFANVFITAPRDEYLADAIVDEIKERYAGEQVLIFTDEEDMALAKYTAQRLQEVVPGSSSKILIDAEELVQQSETISETLQDGSAFDQTYYTPLITVLVSGDKGVGQKYIDKITTMDANNLKAFGVKFIPQYDATIRANQAHLGKLLNIGFAYSAERLANVYGAEEKALIKKFQDMYCKPPSKAQQVGYDVVMDVVDRMNPSGNLHNELERAQARFSTKFQYERLGPNLAHVNKGIRMVRLYKKTESDIPQ